MSEADDAEGLDDERHGFRLHVSTERVTLPNGVTLSLDIVRHPGEGLPPQRAVVA